MRIYIYKICELSSSQSGDLTPSFDMVSLNPDLCSTTFHPHGGVMTKPRQISEAQMRNRLRDVTHLEVDFPHFWGI